MEKLSKLGAIAIGILLVLGSCQDNLDKALVPEADPAEAAVTYEIELIRGADKEELALAGSFLSESSSNGKTQFHFGTDYVSIDAVEYTNLDGVGIVITYDGDEKNGDELSLILAADEHNKLITYYEHDRRDRGDTYEVRVYHEGVAWFSAEVDKNTEEIINYVIFETKSDDDSEEEGIGFYDCLGIAISACLDDSQCAFMCGILWKYCLSSIALACALVAI